MLVTFKEEYLEEMYRLGKCSDRKHRYQPQIIRGYQKRILMLQSAEKPESLYLIKSLNFEALRGDKAGLFSVRVNDQYRIEFQLNNNYDNPLLTVCNIIELSNHYK